MTQQEVIKKFMASLDKTTLSGTAAVDEAINSVTGGKFKTLSALTKQLLNDRGISKNGDDFLKRYCGINLEKKSTEDSGAITGKDAGGSEVKTGTSVVPNGKFDTSFNKTSFTKRGVTFKIFSLKDDGYLYSVSSLDELTSAEKHVWQGLYSFWAEESLKLIEESYGYSFKDNDTKATTIWLYFIDDPNEATAETRSGILTSFNGKETYMAMNINMYYFKNINQNDLDGKHPTWINYYLDRLIAHELTHAVMQAKVENFDKLPDVIAEGIAELTGGMDDSQYEDIEAAVKSKDVLAKYLDNKNDNLFNEDYVGGYILLRYLARQFGDLSISNGNSNTSVSGFYGNDHITNIGNNVTISGGAGKDTIENYGASNVNIKGEGDADSITSYGTNATIDGGAGDNYILIYNNSSNVSVKTDSGKDTIYSGGQKVKISSGTGNDYVYLYTASTNTSVDAGSGNDEVYSGGQNISIDGGAGNDYIHLYTSSDNVSVKAGKGNDTIRNYSTLGNIYQYESGDGNDTIVGISANDTIKIVGGTYDTVTMSGSSNVTLKVGSGSIVVEGGKNVDFKIVPPLDPDIISLTSGNDNYDVTGSGKTIYALAGNDTVKNTYTNVTIYSGNGKDYIQTQNRNVAVYGENDNDSILNTSTNVTIYGGAGNDSIRNDSASTSATIHGDAGNDTILNNGTGALIYGDAGNDKISLGSYSKKATINGGDGTDTIYGNSDNDNLYGDDGNDKLYGYAGIDMLSGGNGNDLLDGGAGNDFLVGGAGNNTLTGGADKDTFYISTGNNYITDYKSSEDKLKLVSGSITSASVSSNDVILNVSTGSKVTLKGCKDKNITVVDSNDKETTKIYPETPTGWKYGNTAKTNLTATLSSAANVDLNQTYGTSVVIVDGAIVTKNISITGNSKANSIKGGKGADTISGDKGNDKLYGGNGNDKLYGDAGNDSLCGEAGADSLYGGTGNDTLTGGDGKDVFIYEGGKDVITDYTAGQDKIKISSGKISKTSYSGNNVIFTIGSGTLTVKNAKGKKISVTDSSNKTQTYSKTFDLICDNNFVTDEFGIDSITEPKFEVTQIQNSNTETFAQDDKSLITFTDK